ncbi:MAG: hypothetical protein K1X92_11150 [Bacteroidia bacterium]|nr:hypothetical protein [Bacteroidia bacterium]
MKKFTFLWLLLFTLVFTTTNAQEISTDKHKEIGVRVYPDILRIGNAEIMWKTQKDSTTWNRFRGGVAGFTLLGNSATNSANTNLMLSFGKEKRKSFSKDDNKIWKDLQLVYGKDFSFGVGGYRNRSITQDSIVFVNSNARIMLGFNAVLGAIYQVNDQFYVGAEVLPGISFTSGLNVAQNPINSNTTNFYSDLQFNTTVLAPSIVLMYKFTKKRK